MPIGHTIHKRRQSRLAAQLAAILREARGARPRRQLAAAAGVVDTTLGDLERGRANPTLSYVESVGELYGIEIRLVADDAPRGVDNGD